MRVLNLCVSTALLLSVSSFAASIIKGRSVSPADFSNLYLFEQYSCAAFCPKNINSNGPPPPGTTVTCPQAYCPSVSSASTVMLTEFESSGITDVTGYVAADTTNRLIVVSFRGSSSILNWITDFRIELINTDICSGCQAHLGFFSSWVEAQTEVVNAITRGFSLYPAYKLVVTGHSLGGAIATIAAAELRKGGYDVALYTYGGPAVGNQALATYISNQTGGNYRVTHSDDPAPQLPLPTWGYAHISPEYWITTGTNVPVTVNDIQILPNNNGDVNTLQNFDVLAHLWYFNSITGCGGCEHEHGN